MKVVTGRTRSAVALAAALLSSAAVAVGSPTPAVASSTWLDRLNAWRASAGLSALTEDTTWSSGDAAHALYMVKNDQVTHYELSTLPYYTVAGDTAARNGNIEVSSTTATTDEMAIDWWMGAPFHALGMMDPRLTTTGFGSYREVKSGWQAGFTLDTLRGNSFTGGTYPVFFPGNGSYMPLTTYSGNEFPDPLQACSGYSVPTGLPVFVEVGGNVATTAGASSFTGNGVPLQYCVIDSNNSAVGSYLTSRGAVILIPRQPLQPGVSYAVTVTVNGVPYAWRFGVSSDSSITAFNCTAAVTVPGTESTTEFSVGLSAPGCAASDFDLQSMDTTLGQGWVGAGQFAATSGAGTGVADGYAGHTYSFRTRARLGGMVGSWSAVASTQILSTATQSRPYRGLYTLDEFGGVNADNSGGLSPSAYWANWNIARSAKAWPGANAPQSGFVLDGWGGLHGYGAAGLSESGGDVGHYWPGWDIARDFAFLPDGTGGVVLDGWGGLHGFGVNGNAGPRSIQSTAYWPGWDIARKVVVFPDGSGGLVMDAWGGLHPFALNGAGLVSGLSQSAYWPGWSIARDLVVVAGHSGYVLDGWGGLHEFHAGGEAAPGLAGTSAYWPGWDIARGVWFVPGSTTQGYVLDGWGGLHPIGGAAAITSYGYWPGRDLAKDVWGG